MKKAAILLAASLALTCAFAQTTKPKPKVAVKSVACPVMKTHKVNIAKATKEGMFADYKGRRYFFCCAGCKPAFKQNPAKFKAAASIPTPKKG